MVGRLRARAPAGPGSPRSPRPCRRAAPPAGRRPRSRRSRRGAPRRPAPCRRRRPADGTRRSASRPPSPARGPPPRARRWCGPSPGRCTSGALAGQRRDRVVGHGQDDRARPPRGAACGSAKARAPSTSAAEPLAPARVAAGDRVDRPAGPGQGDAEGGPDRARPDDPDDRRLARARSAGGVGVVARVDSSPWRWMPGGTGSRSIPAASMAASVSARSRSGSSPGRSPQALIGPRHRAASGASAARARYACTHRV